MSPLAGGLLLIGLLDALSASKRLFKDDIPAYGDYKARYCSEGAVTLDALGVEYAAPTFL